MQSTVVTNLKVADIVKKSAVGTHVIDGAATIVFEASMIAEDVA